MGTSGYVRGGYVRQTDRQLAVKRRLVSAGQQSDNEVNHVRNGTCDRWNVTRSPEVMLIEIGVRLDYGCSGDSFGDSFGNKIQN